MLDSLDVANARAGRTKCVDQVRIANVRIVELHRERITIGIGLAHEPKRSHVREEPRGVPDDTPSVHHDAGRSLLVALGGIVPSE